MLKPHPIPSDTKSSIRNSSIVCLLVILKSNYNLVRTKEDDKYKEAFITRYRYIKYKFML